MSVCFVEFKTISKVYTQKQSFNVVQYMIFFPLGTLFPSFWRSLMLNIDVFWNPFIKRLCISYGQCTLYRSKVRARLKVAHRQVGKFNNAPNHPIKCVKRRPISDTLHECNSDNNFYSTKCRQPNQMCHMYGYKQSCWQ